VKNLAIGAARAFFLMLLCDCLLFIYINVKDSLKYIDLTSLIIELTAAAISLYIIPNFFKNKGDGPLTVSNKINRAVVAIILAITSIIIISVLGSLHHIRFSIWLGYLSLFSLIFLTASYALRVK